jgi:DNA mismatch repair ATPase MutS
MKAHLLFRDRDVDFTVAKVRWYHEIQGPDLTTRQKALIEDLQLDILLRVMARGDSVLFDISRRVLLSSLTNPDDIVYRQEVLGDCLRHPQVIRDLLALAIEAIGAEESLWGSLFTRPETLLRRSVDALGLFVTALKQLRETADRYADQFTSTGFSIFFSMIKDELDDEYFAIIDDHLSRLKLRSGVLMSARLGTGLRPTGYVLRTPEVSKISFKERMRMAPRTEYHWDLPPRDEAGGRALTEMSNRGVNLVANALAQSTNHIKSFFFMLWIELGFYVACLNLYESLTDRGECLCVPDLCPWEPPDLSFSGIYDPCLALRTRDPVVGNNADASGKNMVMITGANSGGKSTLLRSIGIAELMTHAGVFASASSFRTNVSTGLFTHFIREEDETMKSGKLDEELARMRAIALELKAGCLVFFNESFAATNEREGSELAINIVRALLDSGIRVLFVTHQYTLARFFYDQHRETTLFLRADRGEDGHRTYELRPGEPLGTAFGEDVYKRIGGLSQRRGTS